MKKDNQIANNKKIWNLLTITKTACITKENSKTKIWNFLKLKLKQKLNDKSKENHTGSGFWLLYSIPV